MRELRAVDAAMMQPSQSERLYAVLIRIDSREDYVPEHMVERLYETALSRGDEARASHLLERLTSPDPHHRRRR